MASMNEPTSRNLSEVRGARQDGHYSTRWFSRVKQTAVSQPLRSVPRLPRCAPTYFLPSTSTLANESNVFLHLSSSVVFGETEDLIVEATCDKSAFGFEGVDEEEGSAGAAGEKDATAAIPE